MKSFHLEIVTPDGLEYNGEIESLLVRTDDGDVEILAGHADYLATLGVGRARIKTEGEDIFASVSGGFLSVARSGVKLVATTFELAKDIDINRAKAAAQRARNAIESAKSDKELLVAKAKLSRAMNRIRVADMK